MNEEAPPPEAELEEFAAWLGSLGYCLDGTCGACGACRLRAVDEA